MLLSFHDRITHLNIQTTNPPTEQQTSVDRVYGVACSTNRVQKSEKRLQHQNCFRLRFPAAVGRGWCL